jgi:hypothetical protein
MENNNISKAIREILSEGKAVTVKQVLETLQSKHNIEAQYRPVFGTLRRLSNAAGKGSFKGLKKAIKAKVVQAPVAEIEEAVVAVEEAPIKKAAKRRKK